MTNQFPRFLRPLVSRPRLTLAALLLGVLAPRAASAVQGAELYRTQSQFYGRFEARVRYAPGEGVVSSFFLWKEGSSSTTSWNELDHEKINGNCRLQTNIWTGRGTQDHQLNTPTFDICADYHTYGIEWTPDYVAWFIDGAQIRRVTGASVTEYTQNASQGMAIHFNVWPGDASFGGTFNASILPVRQYISWVQYSSYANGAFQQQWREEFNGSTMPSGWAAGDWPSPFNLSRHNPANVSFVNGIAVLSLTADNATGFSGTPPADTGGGAPGTGGAGGTGTGGAGTGGAGRGGAGGLAGGGGRGGAGGSGSPGSAGTSSAGRGGSGTGGAAGNGAGGVAAGTAGSGAGGMVAGTAGAGGVASGTAGSGAGGVASGAAGSGTGGVAVGTAGSGGGGPSGSAGAFATGGTSATGGGGAAATGGTSGTGGTPSGDDGCGCRVAGDGLTGGSIVLLLIAARARRRRSPIVKRPPQT